MASSNMLFFTIKPKEEKWGTNANCYAYAVNCAEPADGANGGAVPGGVIPGAKSLDEYKSALVAGAVQDGLVKLDNDLDDPPSKTEGYYVVALICNQNGFHWLRRDEMDKTWSWKDGNGETVKHTIYVEKKPDPENKDTAKKNELVVDVIKDGTSNSLSTLLKKENQDQQHIKYYGWRYTNMQFISYFRVPNEGLTVRGRPTVNLQP